MENIEKLLIKREELDGIELTEVETKLTTNIEAFKDFANTITDFDELETVIQFIDDVMKADKTYIDSVSYKLGEGCDYQDDPSVAAEHFKASAIFNKIIYFLNKNEVEWSYTLGMHQLVRFWKTNPTGISYGAYDSTLRLLGQTKFKGDNEWKDILVINNYMGCCHDGYTRDSNWLMYHNTLMNILLDREKLINKNTVDEKEAVIEDMKKDLVKESK